MVAENPAVAFLQDRRALTAEGLVREYARYVLAAADAHRLPVPLEAIENRFSLPVRRRSMTASGAQRGWTTPELEIYLNADDLPTVQSFTFGHELIELLFIALRDGAADGWMDDTQFVELQENKEALCEKGAAEIVLPMDLFEPLATAHPLSLGYARRLARECGVSLTATVRRMFQTGKIDAVFAVWNMRHAKKDRVPSRAGQLNFLGAPDAMDDPPRMRLDRCFKPEHVTAYLPENKSVPPECAIHRAHRDGLPAHGWDDLDLSALAGRFFVEAEPFVVDGERRVLSLIHLGGEPPPGAPG